MERLSANSARCEVLSPTTTAKTTVCPASPPGSHLISCLVAPGSMLRNPGAIAPRDIPVSHRGLRSPDSRKAGLYLNSVPASASSPACGPVLQSF